MRKMSRKSGARGSERELIAGWSSMALLLIVLSAISSAAADQPQVVLNVSQAGPRAVEPLTERSLLRDYKFAWSNLALAMESNSAAPLNGLFVGNASNWLHQAVKHQAENGLTSRYLNQNHKVEAVFYAPEGDVIELHDVAEYDYEIVDAGKTIHSEHATVRYVVLMTPGADRWVVRQLQSVQQF
jgi:hypothetical protein